MKKAILAAMTAGVLQMAGAGDAAAQSPVATGILDTVRPAAGIVRLRSDQLGMRPVFFYGMESANILTVDGYPLTIDDLSPGMRVTFFFTRYGTRWGVSKVLVDEVQANFDPYAVPTVPNNGWWVGNHVGRSYEYINRSGNPYYGYGYGYGGYPYSYYGTAAQIPTRVVGQIRMWRTAP